MLLLLEILNFRNILDTVEHTPKGRVREVNKLKSFPCLLDGR